MAAKNNYTILIHIMAWLLLFLLPLFFFSKQTIFDYTHYYRYLITPISLCAIFYINYLYLVNRYLLNNKIKQYIIYNAIIILITCFINYHWERYFSPHPRVQQTEQIERQKKDESFTQSDIKKSNIQKAPDIKKEKKPKPHRIGKKKFIWWHIIWNVISYVSMIGLAIAIRTTYDWYITREKMAEKKSAEIEAELKNLKSQLNPHFLFNTLNNIYALIAISQEKSQEAVMELSKMLRYVLYESDKEFVPLEKEIDFTYNYIELMKLRLQSNVELKVNLDKNNNNIQIAPLLFISLVENTFKHGIAGNKQLKSFIDIDIHREEDSTIICKIENSYHPKNSESDKSGSGIGIENLKRRLELIYPQAHTFTQGVVDNRYISTLIINTKITKKNDIKMHNN